MNGRRMLSRFVRGSLRAGRRIDLKVSAMGRRLVCETLRGCWTKSEEPVWTNEGFQMMASPHDYTSSGIFFFGTYDPWMTDMVKTHVAEGGTCWDVGTERGWFTLLMAKLVGPAGRVDAFEAYPPNYKKLVANVSLNRFDWVNAHPVAVADHVGHMNFVGPEYERTQRPDRAGSGTGHLVSELVADSIQIATSTLDEYARQTGIQRLDFVKLDIEGSEAAAITGGREVITRFRPIVAVEYNQSALHRASSSVEQLDALFEEMGYDRFTFEGTLRILKLQDWRRFRDDEMCFNVYCFPRKGRNGA